jgi:hypothetical protein
MATKHTSSTLHEIVGFDQVSKRKGIFKVYQGYFYTHGRSSDKLSHEVDARLTQAGIKHTMVDHGNHYADFRGGAPLSQQSHFWATFTVDE